MINKKITIIISLCVVILLFGVAIFLFKNKITGLQNNTPLNQHMGEEELAKKLRNNHPDLTPYQMKFYQDIASSNEAEKEIVTCLGREDEKNCLASVAFLRGDENLCYVHGHGAEYESEEEQETEAEEEKFIKNCVSDILKNDAMTKITKCRSFDGDDFYNCVKELFSIYEKPNECVELENKEAITICEDVFNYQDAYSKYDRNSCAGIRNQKLNKYCLDNIIDESQDTDGDGLKDLDEINKYKTHYLFSDTDGDGISDSQEIMAGTNPLEKN